jgi:hypothetical protein
MDENEIPEREIQEYRTQLEKREKPSTVNYSVFYECE